MPDDPEDQALLAWLRSPPSTEPDAPALPPRPRYDPAFVHAERLAGKDLKPKRQHPPFTELERVFLPENRPFTGEDAANARMWAERWADFEFTADDARGWLKAGLEPEESTLATMLEAEGIRPWQLLEPIVHRVSGEHTTILDVARRAPQTYVYDKEATFSDVLDAAGIARDRRPELRRYTKFERQIMGVEKRKLF